MRLLAFIFLNRAFSTGYSRFKQKNHSFISRPYERCHQRIPIRLPQCNTRCPAGRILRHGCASPSLPRHHPNAFRDRNPSYRRFRFSERNCRKIFVSSLALTARRHRSLKLADNTCIIWPVSAVSRRRRRGTKDTRPRIALGQRREDCARRSDRSAHKRRSSEKAAPR